MCAVLTGTDARGPHSFGERWNWCGGLLVNPYRILSIEAREKRRLLEWRAVLIEVKSWESTLIRSGALKSKAQPLPEDVQAALAMESPVIMNTLAPQGGEKLRKAPLPPDMRKDEVFKSIVNCGVR